MSNSFIYLKTGKEIESSKIQKLLTKILGKADYEVEGRDGIYRLTLSAGQKGQALLQSSFIAASEDLASTFKGLIVPMFSERFIPYIDLVEANSIKYLFEVGHNYEQVYNDNIDLLEGIDSYTLLTVKSYIESGNSPSLASLRLYVHRNTVTYRIDRFIQQTGIDLKAFPNSVFVYFLIVRCLAASQEDII
jgi:sugar diacid utilization regulator